MDIPELLALPGAEDIELEIPTWNDRAQAADFKSFGVDFPNTWTLL